MNQIPRITVKAVPFHYVEGQLLVALVSRLHEKSQSWRLPETDVYNVHTSLQYLEQMLRTKCGLTPRNVRYREQLYTFEEPSSDMHPKNTLCLTYLYLSDELVWHKGSDHIGLFPIHALPSLSPLDARIIHYATERLQAKALYTTLPAFLLPTTFTLDRYQQVFETLTGKTVDRRNFRKKLRTLGVITPATSNSSQQNGGTKYTLVDQQLSILPKSF